MANRAAPLSGLSFLRAYVVTMRPYLLFISGAAGLVGLSFARGLPAGRVVLAFVPLFLSYGLGQALTDCFQTDTDAISAPYRPLVRGVVTKRQVLLASFAGLAAVVAVLAYLDLRILALGAAAVVGLVTYTWFKRRWWGGPPWNAWIVALIPVMGRLVDAGWSPAALVRPGTAADLAFGLAVLAVFAGYANFVVVGYLKDVSADRATGYGTFPVVFGWRATAFYGDATALAAAALSACSLALLRTGPAGAVVWAGAAVFYVLEQAAVHRVRGEREAGAPIANGVRALVLLCLAVTIANQPSWVYSLAAYYALFEVALRLRPERGQV